MSVQRLIWDSTTNKDLLVGDLFKLFDDTQREAKVEYPVICNDLTTKDYYIRVARKAGLSRPVEVQDGESISLQLPIMGGIREYTQKFYSMGFRMSFAMDKYNKYNLWADNMSNMAMQMKEGKDVEVFKMFNNLTSTTYSAGFDSLAIAHATHTGLNPNTTDDNFSNYLDASLSQSALQSGRYYFETHVDTMGHWKGMKATHLVYQSTLWPTVNELLGSSDKPGEASNTINILPKLGLKQFECHRLTSTTCWFLIAKDKTYDFNVITAMEPKVWVKDAPDMTLDKVAMSLQHFAFGAGDAANIYVGNT